MIKSLYEKSKQSLSPKFGYREVFDKNTYISLKKADNVDIPEHEYHSRYKSLMLCAWISLAFLAASIMQSFTASDIIGIIICCLAAAIFGMFYFSYVYKLWAARLIYDNKFKGKSHSDLNLARFIDDATVNPANMIPIKIKRKAGHG